MICQCYRCDKFQPQTNLELESEGLVYIPDCNLLPAGTKVSQFMSVSSHKNVDNNT